jgi:hypothetical protein
VHFQRAQTFTPDYITDADAPSWTSKFQCCNRIKVDLELKEELIRARLSHLGFDLEREPGGRYWIVRDRREGNESMKVITGTRIRELDVIVELFRLKL